MEKYLRAGLKLPKDISTNLDNLNIGFAVPVSDAVIDVRIEPRVKRDPAVDEAIFMILSYERTGELVMGHFADYLDAAREEARKLFKALLVDSYRKSFKEEEH
jgi:hypothetical protein